MRFEADRIFAPRRGKPPPVPEGYEREPGDDYIFRRKLLPCVYRQEVAPTKRCCGGTGVSLKCLVIDETVTRQTCLECGARPEWIKQ
jgi:hypothetical protein